MTYLLQEALRRVSALPPTEQDRIAQAMLALAAFDESVEEISDGDLPAVLEGIAQIERGETVSYDEMKATIAKYLK
jgi:predicted transcriptional regulator